VRIAAELPNYKELKMTTFPPLAHVALTVRDLTVSTAWYEDALRRRTVIDEDTDPISITPCT
jgi:hypothetical protein